MAKRKSVGARFVRGIQVGGTTTPTKSKYVQHEPIGQALWLALYTRAHSAREIDQARNMGLI